MTSKGIDVFPHVELKKDCSNRDILSSPIGKKQAIKMAFHLIKKTYIFKFAIKSRIPN
jgi:hypothetical protein